MLVDLVLGGYGIVLATFGVFIRHLIVLTNNLDQDLDQLTEEVKYLEGRINGKSS